VAGTCSLVDWMYVTMGEIHIKTNRIGLQLQAEGWYEQEELPQA
jgi:hypothetical protein